MKNNKKPVVLVTDVHRKAGAIVIQTLAKGGFYVIASSSNNINPGFFSRFCSDRVIHPSSEDNKKLFQEWLVGFVRKRKIDMVILISSSSFAVNEIQDEIKKYTKYLGPDHNTYIRGHAKIPTMKAAMEAGIPIPKTWFPQEERNGIDDVIKVIDEWPVLVKPSVSYAAKGIMWCYNAEELKANFQEIKNEYKDCFVQEFIPPGKFQYKCDWLIDENQNKIAGFVFGKARWYPPDGGSSTMNFVADRPDILEYTYKLLKHMNWIGFCDMDWIDDPRDDKAKLMEINARFPDTVEMGISAGIEFPILMYRIAQGEKIEPVLDYEKDRYLRFLPADFLWFLSVDNKRRFNTWPNWFKFFDKNTRYQLLSIRDPGVIIGYLLENLIMARSKQFWRDRLRIGKIFSKKK